MPPNSLTVESIQELQEVGMPSRGASQELRRTTKAKLAVLLPADHRRAEIAPSDPEVQLAAEVRARARTRTLQERCPGTRARAPCQKGAQPDRRIRRHKLDGAKLACARKAKAAC